MDDVQGLYIVTGGVFVTLLAWVVFVLVRAPTAKDESQPTTVRPPKKKGEPVPPVPPPPKAPEPAPRASSEPSHPSADPFPLVAPLAPAVPVVREAAPPATTDIVKEAAVAVAVVAEGQESKTPALEPAPEPAPDPPPPPPAPDLPAPPVARALVAEAEKTAADGALAKAASQPRVRTMLGLPSAIKPREVPGRAPAPTPSPTPTPGAPAATAPGAPVVVLPPMRSRLDSHPEIQDSAANATVIVMPDEKDGKVGALMLVSAVGRSEPASGRSPEKHAVVERHHLFVFADGSGKKVGQELASAIAVEAFTQTFEKDEPSAFVDDPALPARANRVRRAVLATNKLLLQRARKAAFAGLSTSALAAYFSPSNDELFIAHVGANRAYRLRRGQLTRLTSPQGVRFLGVTDKVDVEVVTEPAQPKDLYLFCSDGLGRALGETELSALLGADPSLEKTTKALIDAVKGKDNTEDVVAIAVRVDPAAPPKKDTGRAKTVMGLG
jgi:serine/threonine protein phosphatase PrpC